MSGKVRPGDVASDIQQGAFVGVALGAAVGDRLTANVNGAVRQLFIARGLTVGSGDVVLIHRFGQLWVASVRLFGSANTEMPPVIIDLDPNPPTQSGALTILPESTGTYYTSGWVDSFVRQGIRDVGGLNGTGAVFYGQKPRSLAGVTVTSARLEELQWLASTGHAPASTTLRLITEQSRPAGAPTLTSTTAGPTLAMGDKISFTIPTAWAQSIVDGTAGGIGMYDADGSPWLQTSGRAQRPAAWTLVVDWTRTY
jgi:hypothetical protein